MHPILLFRPVLLLIFRQFSALYYYLALYYYSAGESSQYKWPAFPVGSVLSQMVFGLISWNIEIEVLKNLLSLN